MKIVCEYDHTVQIHIILMKSNILYVTINIVLYKTSEKREEKKSTDEKKNEFMADVFR